MKFDIFVIDSPKFGKEVCQISKSLGICEEGYDP